MSFSESGEITSLEHIFSSLSSSADKHILLNCVVMAKGEYHTEHPQAERVEIEALPDWVVRPDVITIEGLAATGKGSVSEILCDRYGYRYLNISSIGRGLAVGFAQRFPWLTENSMSLADYEITIPEFYETAVIEAKVTGMSTRVRINGVEVTKQLHTPETDAAASYLFGYEPVRRRVAEFARDFATEGNIILDGRTVAATVAPEADLHIFLETDREERIRRRYQARLATNPNVTIEQVAAEVDERDRKEKLGGAHHPFGGSLIVDTTGATAIRSAREIVTVYNTLQQPTRSPEYSGRRRGRPGLPWRGDLTRTGFRQPNGPLDDPPLGFGA